MNRRVLLALGAISTAACHKQQELPCPDRAPAPSVLPGVTPEQRTVEYWIARQREPDAVILDADDVRAHNLAFGEDSLGQFDMRAPLRRSRLMRDLREQLGYLRERIEGGQYVMLDGSKVDATLLAKPSELPALCDEAHGGELRLAKAYVALHCGPMDLGLYKAGDIDQAFDRNLCSMLRPGDPVAILAEWPNGMKLAHDRATLGWISDGAPLSLPLPAQEADDVLREREAVRPLTRRAFLQEAFKYLGAPYGWGGWRGGLDCSELVLDVLGAFGIRMPRNSQQQALAASMSIDLSGVAANDTRLKLLDAAQERGVVLLVMREHIMLYLGRNAAGVPMVLHSLSDYLEPCTPDAEGKPRETAYRVDRVEVTDLAVGRGTSRKSYLERLTRIALFARTPGDELAAKVERRPPAPVTVGEPHRCEKTVDDGVTLSVAASNGPLRAEAQSSRDLGPVGLTFVDPDGESQAPEIRLNRGPPWLYSAEVRAPRAGEWTVRLGDGPRLFACKSVRL